MEAALRYMRIMVGRVGPFEGRMNNVWKVWERLPPLPILAQMLSLNFK